MNGPEPGIYRAKSLGPHVKDDIQSPEARQHEQRGPQTPNEYEDDASHRCDL